MSTQGPQWTAIHQQRSLTQRNPQGQFAPVYLTTSAALEQATADPHMEGRGLDSLNLAFNLDACDSHTHEITDLRRLTDQTHRARLRLLLPLKLHGLQARRCIPLTHRCIREDPSPSSFLSRSKSRLGGPFRSFGTCHISRHVRHWNTSAARRRRICARSLTAWLSQYGHCVRASANFRTLESLQTTRHEIPRIDTQLSRGGLPRPRRCSRRPGKSQRRMCSTL